MWKGLVCRTSWTNSMCQQWYMCYVLQKNVVTYKGGSVAMMMAYANMMPLSLYYSGDRHVEWCFWSSDRRAIHLSFR